MEKQKQIEETLCACIGCDTEGNPVMLDIRKSPHVLIAGAMGSGKSICIHTIINSVLRFTPNEVRLLLVDTKMVEFSVYKNLPHLYVPIVKDAENAVKIIKELCGIVEERRKEMEENGYSDFSQTNYSQILLIIDEFAGLMCMCKDEIEPLLITIAQLGGAVGIHLILATQCPTSDVVTDSIKANMPCRIALRTSSISDSMTILGCKGAEQLKGCGDAILKRSNKAKETRLQISYINHDNMNAIVDI